MNIIQKTVSNHLVATMSTSDFDLIELDMSRAPLVSGELGYAGEQIRNIIFPEGGVLSAVSTDAAGEGCEISVFGQEGMSAPEAVLGKTTLSHNIVVVMAAASALIVPIATFRKALSHSSTLTTFMLQYVQNIMHQQANAIVAASSHPVDRRLARLILMYSDRLEKSPIRITQDVLSHMLNLRRASVTTTLHRLSSLGLIDSRRREINVINRAGLAQFAGAAYTGD